MAKRTIVLTTKKKLARGTGLSGALGQRAAYLRLLAEMAKVNPRSPISIRNFFDNILPPFIIDFPFLKGELDAFINCRLDFFAQGERCLGNTFECPNDYTCTGFQCAPDVRCPNGFTCPKRYSGLDKPDPNEMINPDLQLWVDFTRFVQRLGVTFF